MSFFELYPAQDPVRCRLMLTLHLAARLAPIKIFRVVDEVLCAVDAKGALVVPVSFDYGVWTEPVS
jgi:hypothetical protein